MILIDKTDDENMDQTEQLTDQPTTSTGRGLPQDTCADAKTIVRIGVGFSYCWLNLEE